MKLTVVIPTLDEASNLERTLASLPAGAEVIVSDGGSMDGTPALAQRLGARVVTGARGRGQQMNRGVEEATGDVLIFIHADCALSPEAAPSIVRSLEDPAVVGGSFRLSVEGGGLSHALVARVSNARARYLKTPYGDQGLFVRKETFERVGGFPDGPILEDVGIARKLRSAGRLVALDAPIVTGTRHWEGLGVLGATLVNWLVAGLYVAGVSPARLAPLYRKLRGGSGTRGVMKPPIREARRTSDP